MLGGSKLDSSDLPTLVTSPDLMTVFFATVTCMVITDPHSVFITASPFKVGLAVLVQEALDLARSSVVSV